MAGDAKPSPHIAWSHFRFSVVGPLLSAPPARGELHDSIQVLSKKTWRHPITGQDVQFSAKTIERWYYKAFKARQDPVGVLRRAIRKDAGRHSALNERLAAELIKQYQQYKHWSVQLHADNLAVLVEQDAALGPMPSYSSVLRFMRARGLAKKRRPRNPHRPGLARAEARLESCEVRSYEAEYVCGLWHLDFHASSLKVLTPRGEWVHPQLLGIVDDRSRLACHAQWYWTETAEDLVHGLCQAFCKRGLPRALMTDNGSAMQAAEFLEGLKRCSIVPEPTLDYSPYQNGKQEVWWATVEGRLMDMLTNVRELTLALLNEATCAWVEMEYNRTRHDEIGQKPIERFMAGPEVSRPSPSSETLRHRFRWQIRRKQRRSDGTITIDGVRFEIPNRFRHLHDVQVQYARWDLTCVHLVDERTETLLAPLYPVDKTRNADGRRRVLEPLHQAEPLHQPPPANDIAPLLRKLMADYAATGIPPAYVPKNTQQETES